MWCSSSSTLNYASMCGEGEREGEREKISSGFNCVTLYMCISIATYTLSMFRIFVLPHNKLKWFTLSFNADCCYSSWIQNHPNPHKYHQLFDLFCVQQQISRCWWRMLSPCVQEECSCSLMIRCNSSPMYMLLGKCISNNSNFAYREKSKSIFICWLSLCLQQHSKPRIHSSIAWITCLAWTMSSAPH